MEQTLHIIQLYESIDRGIREHGMTRHQIKLADLTEGSQWLIDECEGQESYDEPDKIIRLKWVLTVDRLTDDQFDFTFCDRTYTLNRYWQVLGTEIYRIPNPYLVELVRYVMYFGTNEGDKSEYPRLKELGDLMMENESQPWKNIPMAREALHLLKDRRKCRTATQAKAFCKKVLSHDLVSPTDTPRLYLSFLDYYHRLLGSAYYKGELTDRLINALDPDYSDEEILDDMRDSYQDSINSKNNNNMKFREEKMKRLHEAAQAGDLNAQYELGLCYFYGKNGLKEDISQGIAWLKEAGMAGYEKAQKKLIDIIPDNYINDSDIIHWLYVYDRSRYDRLCAIHQMMM